MPGFKFLLCHEIVLILPDCSIFPQVPVNILNTFLWFFGCQNTFLFWRILRLVIFYALWLCCSSNTIILWIVNYFTTTYDITCCKSLDILGFIFISTWQSIISLYFPPFLLFFCLTDFWGIHAQYFQNISHKF